MEVNDRKKAKQAYLESLARQKASAQPIAQDHAPAEAYTEPVNVDKQSRRDKLLDEKRKAFFEQSQPPASNQTASAIAVSRPAEAGSMVPMSAMPAGPDFSFQLPKIPSLAPPMRSDKQQDEGIRLSDWQKLGYPSEFTYAKSLGLLNDKKPVQQPVLNAIGETNGHGMGNAYPQSHSTDQTPGDAKRQLQADYARALQMDTAAATAAVGRGQYGQGHDISSGMQFGHADDADSKRRKQEQYASELKQQQQDVYTRSNFAGADNARALQQDAANGNNMHISHMDDGDSKRRKQEQYASELRQQQQQQQQQGSGNQAQPNRGTGQQNNSFAIGQVDDRELKRRQQAEYALALHQDTMVQQPQSQQQQQHRPHGNDINQGNSNNSNNMQIGQVEDKGSKRRKQEQYASELKQQQQDSHITRDAGMQYEGFSLGQLQDGDAKRRQQADYARALQQDAAKSSSLNQPHPSSNNMQIGHFDDEDSKRRKQEQYASELRQQQQQAQALPSRAMGQQDGGFAIGQVDDRELKRRRQAEYAQALQHDTFAQQPQQQPQHRGQSNDINQGSSNNSNNMQIGHVEDKDSKRRKQEQYASELRQQQQIKDGGGRDGGYASNGFAFGGEVDRDEKKRQQADYARALQQQVATKGDPEQRKGPGAGGRGELDAGYTIGPLGMPVRQTIQVGRRELQKAYNAQAAGNLPDMHGAGTPQYAAEHGPACNEVIAEPQGLLGLSDHAEEAKARKLKQQRLLEQQIADNKERIRLEKQKEEEDDRRLEQRLEKERKEIQEATERDRMDKKKREELDAKKALEMQIELARKAKEEESQKLVQLEAKENRRLELEREAIRLREAEELRRETAIHATSSKAIPEPNHEPIQLPRGAATRQQQQWGGPANSEPSPAGPSRGGLRSRGGQRGAEMGGMVQALQHEHLDESQRFTTEASSPFPSPATKDKEQRRQQKRAALFDPAPDQSIEEFPMQYRTKTPPTSSSSRRQDRAAMQAEGISHHPSNHHREARNRPVDSDLPPRGYRVQTPLAVQRAASVPDPLSMSSSLNLTLQGESRFLMPDGRVVGSAWPLEAPAVLLDSLQQHQNQLDKRPKTSTSTAPVPVPVPVQIPELKFNIPQPVTSSNSHISARDADDADDLLGSDGFDVEKELRKSRRKWQLLQRLNGIHNAVGFEAQGIFGSDGISDGLDSASSSRPSSASWEQSSSSRGALGRAGKLAMHSSFAQAVEEEAMAAMRASASKMTLDPNEADLYSRFGL